MTQRDIFFSYARKDKERIRPIVHALEAQGWTVWWDIQILPGEKFDDVIERALENVRCVIVAWSKNSVHRDWVKDEAGEGKERDMLVPILIDDVSIPLGFRRIHAANLVQWNGDVKDAEFQNLITAISKITGSKGVVPKSEPAPAKTVSPAPLIVKNVQKTVTAPKPAIMSFGFRAGLQPGVILDPGALNAMIKGAELYPVGILDVVGNFGILDRINLYDQNNILVADGLAEYASSELRKIKGKKSNQISMILGYRRSDAVVATNSVSWKRQNQPKPQMKVVTNTSASAGIVVDVGAIRAMRAGSNLLPIGVLNVTGYFPVGATINIYDSNQRLVAQGVTEYSSGEIQRIMGKHSSAILSSIGAYRGDMIVQNQLIFWK